MTPPAPAPIAGQRRVAPGRPAAAVTIAALQHGLSERAGRTVTVTACQLRPLHGYSTHPISRLTAMADGEPLSLVWKRLGHRTGRDVRREVLLYRTVLANRGHGAPQLHASVCDEAQERYWLFLEDVGDRRLDRSGVASWKAVLRWLARLHGEHDCRGPLIPPGHLAVHDRAFYWSLAVDARSSVRWASPQAGRRFQRLMGSYGATVDALTAQEPTLVHGSLSAQNVHLQKEPHGRLVVRPVDWEAAAVGAPAWDLAKLLSGWGNAKQRLLGVYLDERRRNGTALVAADLQISLGHAEILRTLRALHWCHSPAAVDQLLDRMAAGWQRHGVRPAHAWDAPAPQAGPP